MKKDNIIKPRFTSLDDLQTASINIDKSRRRTRWLSKNICANIANDLSEQNINDMQNIEIHNTPTINFEPKTEYRNFSSDFKPEYYSIIPIGQSMAGFYFHRISINNKSVAQFAFLGNVIAREVDFADNAIYYGDENTDKLMIQKNDIISIASNDDAGNCFLRCIKGLTEDENGTVKIITEYSDDSGIKIDEQLYDIDAIIAVISNIRSAEDSKYLFK